MPRLTASLTIALAAFVAVVACASTVAPTVGGLEVVSGDGQTGLAGVPLPDSLVVRVVDENGAAVPGAVVTWSTTAGHEIAPVSARTGNDGIAMTLWIPGGAGGSVTAAVSAFKATFQAVVGPADPAVTYLGRNGYISYTPGTVPLILSAPHGGQLEPAEIADRTQGTLVRDTDTDLLVLVMADSIEAHLGGRPHVVISHLHRRKLDPNRDITEAAQGHPLGEHAWLEFQGFIEHARRAVEEQFGAGFYLDIHVHGHAIQRLELGYLLDRDDLSQSHDALAAMAGRSSIATLANLSPLPFPDLVRGQDALGTLFEDAGVPAVPSLQQPEPGPGDPFFSGGYNTRRHGSRDGGVIDGVQIESHRPGIRDTPENRAWFGGVSAAALKEFMRLHYGVDATTPAPSPSRPARSSPP